MQDLQRAVSLAGLCMASIVISVVLKTTTHILSAVFMVISFIIYLWTRRLQSRRPSHELYKDLPVAIQDYQEGSWPIQSPLEHQISRIARILIVTLVVITIATLVVGFIRALVVSSDYKDWLYFILEDLVKVVLPLLTPSYFLTRYVMKRFEKATFCSKISQKYSSCFADNVAVESLGAVTVCCFVDKTGILAENYAIPERVFVFQDRKPVILESTGLNHVEFEGNWSRYAQALRPLAFSSMFCVSCYGNVSKILSDERIETTADAGQKECLCHVGQALGFDKDSVEYQYEMLSMYHSFHEYNGRRKLSMSVMSLKDISSPMLQLFTRGAPTLVAEHCDYYWNGSTVVPLNHLLRNRFLHVARRWMLNDLKVFAIGYTPVPPHRAGIIEEMSGMFLDAGDSHYWDEKQQPVHDLEELNRPILLDSGQELLSETSTSSSSSSDESILPRKGEYRKRIRRESWEEDPETKSVKDVDKEVTFRSLQCGQILLGMIATREQPKPGVSSLVDDLNSAGVRFVLFSDSSMRKSIGFAGKIGLPTDWNFFICLQDGGKAVKNNISKMPVGISAIRDHLKNVDNVPLLISLFTNSTIDSVTEMIKIFQENGDVVLCIGSCTRIQNSNIFFVADVAICVDTSGTKKEDNCLLRRRSKDDFENDFRPDLLHGCDLSVGNNVEIRAFVRDALSISRSLLENARQALLFGLGATLMITIISAVPTLLGAPTVLEVYQLVWIVYIICPPLVLTILLAPANNNILKTLPDKNISREHFRFIGKYILLFIIRCVPTCVVLLILFLTYLGENLNQLNIATYHWIDSPTDVYESTDDRFAILLQAQNYIMLGFVYHMCFLCATFQHRCLSITSISLQTHRPFIFTCFVVFSLQILFCICSLSILSSSMLSPPSLALWMLCVIWPIALLLMNEFAKHWYTRFFSRYQRRLRIIFDTKLGMHSPQ